MKSVVEIDTMDQEKWMGPRVNVVLTMEPQEYAEYIVFILVMCTVDRLYEQLNDVIR